ncbi:hypothetical protein LguiA_029608 [Lonicera macranthoides]
MEEGEKWKRRVETKTTENKTVVKKNNLEELNDKFFITESYPFNKDHVLYITG